MQKRDFFCAAPWSGLSVDPNGYAKVCCVSQTRIEFRDVQSSQDSQEFNHIRQQVIENQQQENCSQCWQQERTAPTGEWNSRRSIYQHDDFFHDLDDATANRLQHLDLRWNNTCNLSCVYCGPVWSSRWSDLLGKRTRNRISTEISDQKLSELRFLQLAGGEPLLIKENIDLLQRLLMINPEVHIEVTSNLTAINNNRVFDLLTQFTNVTMVASFEATHERFEYIRHGAAWKDFSQNFKICSNRFARLQANMVFFPLSGVGIIDAIGFALEHIPSQNIFIREQIGGHGFDRLAKGVLNSIKQHIETTEPTLSAEIYQQLHNLIMQARSDREHTDLPNYDKFDQLTGSDHRVLFHELYQ